MEITAIFMYNWIEMSKYQFYENELLVKSYLAHSL